RSSARTTTRCPNAPRYRSSGPADVRTSSGTVPPARTAPSIVTLTPSTSKTDEEDGNATGSYEPATPSCALAVSSMRCPSEATVEKSAKIRQDPGDGNVRGIDHTPSESLSGCRCWYPVRSVRSTIRCNCLSCNVSKRVTTAPSGACTVNRNGCATPATNDDDS